MATFPCPLTLATKNGVEGVWTIQKSRVNGIITIDLGFSISMLIIILGSDFIKIDRKIGDSVGRTWNVLGGY